MSAIIGSWNKPDILSAEQVEQYQRDGILFSVRVLAPEEVVACRSMFHDLVERLGANLRRLSNCHRYFPWAYDLATHPAVLRAVSILLGPNVLIYGTLILSKPARSRSYVSWHQDGAYATYLGAAPMVTAWIALSKSSVESGCMRAIPGSQTQKFWHSQAPTADNLLNRGQTVETEVDEGRAVDVVLEAGEMSLHDVNLIHGSNPNRSDHDRTGFVVRYTTPAIRSGTEVVPAAGNDPCEHLRVIARPARADYENYTNYLQSSEQNPRRADEPGRKLPAN